MLVHMSMRLFQTPPAQQSLHHLFEPPHNLLHHMSQMLILSGFVPRLNQRLPSHPNLHYTLPDSVLFHRNSLPLPAYLQAPWSDNQIHDFPVSSHRIRDTLTYEVQLPLYHILPESAFPSKNPHHPTKAYPDCSSFAHQSMS